MIKRKKQGESKNLYVPSHFFIFHFSHGKQMLEIEIYCVLCNVSQRKQHFVKITSDALVHVSFFLVVVTLNFVPFYFPISFTFTHPMARLQNCYLSHIFFAWPAFRRHFVQTQMAVCVYVSMKMFHHVVKTYQYCTPCAIRDTSQIIKQFHIIFGRNGLCSFPCHACHCCALLHILYT